MGKKYSWEFMARWRSKGGVNEWEQRVNGGVKAHGFWGVDKEDLDSTRRAFLTIDLVSLSIF